MQARTPCLAIFGWARVKAAQGHVSHLCVRGGARVAYFMVSSRHGIEYWMVARNPLNNTIDTLVSKTLLLLLLYELAFIIRRVARLRHTCTIDFDCMYYM